MNARMVLQAQLALFAVCLVSAATLARCFTGPGELAVALASVLAAEAVVVAGTLLSPRHRGAAAGVAFLGVVLVAMVPVWLVAGGATTLGWPTFFTGHVLASDLSHSWHAFNSYRAPVPELPGLVLVCGWAAGGATLLAGWAAAGGDTPLWVAAPPTALFLFTSALGTSAWRAPAIAADVAALSWYAVASRATHRLRGSQLAVPDAVASMTGTSGTSRPRAQFGPGFVAAAIVLTAAILASLVGPRLPGAVDAAVVSLRSGQGIGLRPSGEPIPAPSGGQVFINTLVQVAEEEIYQPNVELFTVHTSERSYLVYTTLDEFDGNAWSQAGSDTEVSSFPLPLSALGTPADTKLVTEQIRIEHLGGSTLPALPVPVAETGPGTDQALYSPVNADLQQDIQLEGGDTVTLASAIPEVSASQEPIGATAASSPPDDEAAQDVELPASIPTYLTNLAHSLVRGLTTDYQKAEALQAYFRSGAFTYSLPTPGTASSGAVSGGEGLSDLVRFLQVTRTGFCQQYASAFAALARIDGLPTRVAVGFVPGKPRGTSTYVVTGADTHAWPQVYLGPEVGWWSFEPTPGSAIPAWPVAANTRIGTGPNTKTPTTLPGGGHGRTGLPKTSTPAADALPPAASAKGAHSHRTSPGPAVPVLLIVLALLVAAVLLTGPSARIVRRRRARDPAGRILGAWSSATSALALVGVVQRRSETFAELARRAARVNAIPAPEARELLKLARDTEVAAFAPTIPPPEVVVEAVEAARKVAAVARRQAGPWRRFVATIDPR
jgi:transglutaminase-like putative cysteine protease